ncbi:MAG: hypothetical protein HQL82_13890 [Magnetococcales bacterium]|nr:hypothetical protein [Magnetococcales bacterium]
MKDTECRSSARDLFAAELRLIRAGLEVGAFDAAQVRELEVVLGSMQRSVRSGSLETLLAAERR